MELGDLQSPGWEAIDGALAPRYAGQEPKHYGTLISYELGGPATIVAVTTATFLLEFSERVTDN